MLSSHTFSRLCWLHIIGGAAAAITYNASSNTDGKTLSAAIRSTGQPILAAARSFGQPNLANSMQGQANCCQEEKTHLIPGSSVAGLSWRCDWYASRDSTEKQCQHEVM